MRLSTSMLFRAAAIVVTFFVSLKLVPVFPERRGIILLIEALLWAVMLIWTYYDICRVEVTVKKMREYPQERRRKKESYRIYSDLEGMLDSMTNVMKQKYEDEMLTKQAELSALQSQMNPHFLYNTLDSIQGQALRSNNKEIAEMTAALSSFFRYSISMKDSIVTVADEIKNVQNYMLIQRYRFGDKINLFISCEDDDIMRCSVPQMILQPVVENAVYHGLERTSKEGQVTLRLSRASEILHIVIEDNGVGMSPELTQELNSRLEQSGLEGKAGERKGGIALRNVNQRIKLMFGEDFGIHIFSAEGIGTKIVLYLPAAGRQFTYEPASDVHGHPEGGG